MKYSSNDIQLKLETAVLTACRQSLPLDNLEVDAIICVNVADRKEEHVVKIHQRFDVCGPAARSYIKLKERLLNDDTDMVLGLAQFEVDAIDKVVKKEILGEKEQNVYVLENQNEQNVHSLENKLHESKENSIDSIKGGSKSFTDIHVARSPSKHPRKSSTPRCLNPKVRQLNSNKCVDTTKEKQYDLNASKLSSLNTGSVYGINDYSEDCSDIMAVIGTEVVMTDEQNEKDDEQSNKNEMYIKIEPNSIDKFTDYKQMLPEKEPGDIKEIERKLDTGKDCSDDLNSSSNDFTIELNSDSESYDTTYNYTFDKSTDEHLEQNSQVMMKSLEDSDDQSLGSSPSALTNSMMSYNVSHIIPVGTMNEGNEILDIPNYTISPQLGKNKAARSKAGGMWNDLTSKKRSDIPSGVEKLSCRTCGAMFSSTRTRRRHENSTCGATRYSCVVCSKLFSRKDARRRHMMRMHPLYLLESHLSSGNKSETVQYLLESQPSSGNKNETVQT